MKTLTLGALGAACLPLLASCGGDACDDWSCDSLPPTEVQYGLTSLAATAADVIGTSMLVGTTPPFAAIARPAGRRRRRFQRAGGCQWHGPWPSPRASRRRPADIVSASVDDRALALFFNDPAHPGTLKARQRLSSPGASQLAIVDINGDGLPDLLSADYSVSLFLQDPAAPGTFFAPLGLYAGGANWVAAGDLNGDGSPTSAR
jgi:hypothetical protein